MTMNNTNNQIDENYSVQLPFNDLLKQVDPIRKDLKQYADEESERLNALWNIRFNEFTEEVKTTDKLRWAILKILDLTKDAERPTAQYLNWINASGFQKMFLSRVDKDSRYHITPESRKACIDENKETINDVINSLSTLDRSSLSHNMSNNSNMHKIMSLYIIKKIPRGFVNDFHDMEKLKKILLSLDVMVENFNMVLENNSTRNCDVHKSVLNMLRDAKYYLEVAEKRKDERQKRK